MKKFLLIVLVGLVGCAVAGCTWETVSQGVSNTSDGWTWSGCHPDFPLCGNVSVDEDGFDGNLQGDFPKDN